MPKLGAVTYHGYDDEGRERRERVGALAECPGCGAEVVLVEETEAWVEAPGERWRHSEYGPAQGVCEACSLLLVDSWDGAHAYQLPKQEGR